MLQGSPLTGSISQGILYDAYEGYGGDTAINDFELIDLDGDNSIKAINVVDANRYYYSFAVTNSTLRTGDGDDSYEIKNSKGYYAEGLNSSSIISNGGNDFISLELKEANINDFYYGLHAVTSSLIDTGSGNDTVIINQRSSKDEESFGTSILSNSSLITGSGNDSINIKQENSSKNLNIFIARHSSKFDFGDGNDTATFISDGYGIIGDEGNEHSIYLGSGDDDFNIESTYSALSSSYLYAGEGNDNLTITSSNEFHHTLVESDIFLGDGNDYLTFKSSKNSNIDGGDGSDIIRILDSSENYIIENLQSNNFEISL